MKKVFLGLLMGCAGACVAGAGESPPADELFFPVDVAVDPTGTRLYVSNGNFNARFDGGTVVALDLLQVEEDGLACRAAQESGTAAPPNCQLRPGVPPTLCTIDSGTGLCSLTDRSLPYIDAAATVKIASFPKSFVLNPAGDRLFFAVRGDESLTMVDLDASAVGDGALFCEEEADTGTLGRCSGAHVLLSDRDASLVDFGTIVPGFAQKVSDVALDFGRQVPGAGEVNLAYVVHLETGFVSVFRLTPDGTPIFQESVFVFTGPSHVAVHPQTGILYIAQRDVNVGNLFVSGEVIQMRRASISSNDPAKLTLIPVGELRPSQIASGGSDYRSLAFGQGGERLYVGLADPSSVLIFDTSLNQFGEPRNQILGRVDVDLAPEQIEVVPMPDGTELVYVSDLDNASLHVIDPTLIESGAAKDRIPVGLGPFGLAFADISGARRLFVANFDEDTISVIDVDPASPTFHEVLYQVGAPRPPEEE